LRTISAIIVIIVCALPALFAGLPGAAPGWFDARFQGAPQGVLFMCGLLALLVVMAVVCSEAAKDRPLPGKEGE
jgi:hypothetical protein